MYLSKNSRYVLQKAQVLSPTFFKVAEKKLSVKTPNDDPTKPPLRLNIPKDTSEEDKSNPVQHLQRSSSTTPAFDDDLLSSSNNDIHFPKVMSDDILINNKSESEATHLEPHTSTRTNYWGVEHKDDNLRTTYSSSTPYSGKDHEKAEPKKAEPTAKGGDAEVDPKSLYIIIDFPEKRNDAEVMKETHKRSDFDATPKYTRRTRADEEKPVAVERSKSPPKIPLYNGRPLRTKKIEVNEIEEPATYVFHMKLDKNTPHKPFGMGWVPEKEVTTRNENVGVVDTQVKTTDVPAKEKVFSLAKKVSSIDLAKHSEPMKKPTPVKSEITKPNLLRASKPSVISPKAEEEPPEKYMHSPVENRMVLPKFERDDSGTIRAFKTYPFKFPVEVENGIYENVETQAGPREAPSSTSGEVSPEQPETKVETESVAGTYDAPNHYYSCSPTPEYNMEVPSQGQRSAPVSHEENRSSLLSIHELKRNETEQRPETAQARNTTSESPYFNIRDLMKEQEEETPEPPPAPEEPAENPSPYFNIRDLQREERVEKSSSQTKNPPPKKYSAGSIQEKPTAGDFDHEGTNFRTSSSCVRIGCEKTSGRLMKFCAAFPPLLSEALKSRFTFRKGSYFSDRLDSIWKNRAEEKSEQTKALSENSILFPKKECEKFDCESLFTTPDEVIMKLIKNSEGEEATKSGDKSGEVPGKNSKEGEARVDSLTLMKKVKEIIQFDLDNVVKIFSGGDPAQVSSVVVFNGDKWQVDEEELKKQVQKSAMQMESLAEGKPNVLGDKIREESQTTKYLPSREEYTTEMRLHSDSVVTYKPDTNEFVINKAALADAITRKTNESPEEVARTLDLLAQGNSLDSKTGDSILVFDDETQSWKVDFSILEKREAQLKIEEELTKRSELILETFEKLEKGQVPTVPFPDTKDRRTFDYKNEQWKAYDSDKKTKEKSTKSPFKESNAEEIRKKNSDLYENLFIGNKKETTMKKSGRGGQGLDSSKPVKKAESYLMSEKESTGSSGQGSTPMGPEPPKPKPDTTPPQGGKENPVKYDENFWESFLNMNILPRDIADIPKISPNKPPPSPAPPVDPKKIEEPLLERPSKKIEEPKFKIRLPFMRDKKIDKDLPTVSNGDGKTETPLKKPPTPPTGAKPETKKQSPPLSGAKPVEKEKPSPPSSGAKPAEKEKPPIKAPPSSSIPKEEPKNKKPSPTVKSPPSKAEIKDPSASPKTIIQNPKPPAGGKTASATDHYVSDKIIEISRNKPTDSQSKIKANKIETVKLNINSDKRVPSKVTEINLNKKCEEKMKETAAAQQNAVIGKTPNEGILKKEQVEKKTFHKNFEKYQTPFSDPDYEEKSLKIKSDIESNPNMKKLDNWNKTLVLHDIMKPPENLESWLKDETDKMATLLLKVLQEASDGKPKKKHPLTRPRSDKLIGKGNTYDNIRKKHETAPENFLFRVRTVNLSLDNDRKLKPGESTKLSIKSEQQKDSPVQPEKSAKPPKLPTVEKVSPTMGEIAQVPVTIEDQKAKVAHTALETTGDSALMSREYSQVIKIPVEITEDIPGPEILKKISNAWKVFPVLGTQMTIFTLLRVFQLVNLGSSILGSPNPGKGRRRAFSSLFLKYGPIVNVQGPLSGNVILIHTPEHLTGVFEQDVTTSVRSVFDSLERSRRDSEENVLTVGISTDWSKPEWSELKKGTIDPLTKGSSVFFGLCDAAGDSLVSNIRRNRNAQNCVSEDFMEEIRRWSLEGLCSVILEKSFAFLDGRRNNMNWIMEPDKLYLAVDEATNCLNKCEKGFQMWRLICTPSSMGLSQAYRSISSILSKQLYQAEMNLKRKGEHLRSGKSLTLNNLTFIESMLLNDGMTTDEITCNLVDIMLIGTNVMNSAMGFLLYNMAQNVKVQMKLLKELKEVLPNKDSQLSYNTLDSLKYLRACLKESLRLHFPIPVFYRVLQTDILLANYIVPRGTYVVMDNRASGMKEQIFDEPDKFMPERWLSEEKWMQSSHPFGAFPLCHGPRSDLAKKVVEMQLLASAAKLIRNFQVEYQYGEIQGTDTIISVPDKQLKLNFVEREQ